MAITLINVFFLAIIFVLFYSGKNETYKMRVLLYGSLIFYVYYEPILTPVLLCISALAFLTGHFLGKFSKHKKAVLWIFFLTLLCLYYPFKYNDTFESILQNVFHFEGLRWLYLPLGLSFYTYKTMTYVLDIYYERSMPQKSIEKYLLFISYFPQIFCGPIMGPDEFFSQLKFKETFDLSEVMDGLRLVVIGVFKKMILANNLFSFIAAAYANPASASGIEWVVISIVTRFYVYYDFSGYSDISNGVSLLFGIKVKKNFDQPFKSKSITEFWRRWHISLSNWIRDYVYYPMVSKFSSYAGIYISLVLSFICIGLWHGDHINYVLYGLINGLAVAFSTYMAKRNRKAPPASKFQEITSRLGLYLFLIFLPSVLLMAHDSATFYQIVESLTNFSSWFTVIYFDAHELISLAYMIIPAALCFELVLVFHGESLKNRFEKLSTNQQVAWMLFIILISFTFISPEVNYRFLYQGF